MIVCDRVMGLNKIQSNLVISNSVKSNALNRNRKSLDTNDMCHNFLSTRQLISVYNLNNLNV